MSIINYLRDVLSGRIAHQNKVIGELYFRLLYKTSDAPVRGKGHSTWIYGFLISMNGTLRRLFFHRNPKTVTLADGVKKRAVMFSDYWKQLNQESMHRILNMFAAYYLSFYFHYEQTLQSKGVTGIYTVKKLFEEDVFSCLEFEPDDIDYYQSLSALMREDPIRATLDLYHAIYHQLGIDTRAIDGHGIAGIYFSQFIPALCTSDLVSLREIDAEEVVAALSRQRSSSA